jgi:hypothetical protein
MRIPRELLIFNKKHISGFWPKSRVNAAGFRLQCGDGAMHLHRALAVGKDFPARQQKMLGRRADNFIQANLAESINHASNLTPINGAGAHGARFGAGIKGAAGELFGRKALARQPHEVGFGMPGAVTPGRNRIFGLQEKLVVLIRQDCPKRMVAVAARLPCDRNGELEMLKFEITHGLPPDIQFKIDCIAIMPFIASQKPLAP